MKTDVRAFDPRTDLHDALAVLRADGVVVHPTETVYGFGGRLTPAAIEAVQHLKRRDAQKPLLVLVPGIDAVEELAWTPEARELAEVFWPGAVTLVLADPQRRFPQGVRSAAGNVAVRQTSHPVASALVQALGELMTSSSANEPGAAPAMVGEEALAVALDREPLGAVHLLDAGGLPSAAPSTIVDCTGERPRVLREGLTPVSRLRCVLPDLGKG